MAASARDASAVDSTTISIDFTKLTPEILAACRRVFPEQLRGVSAQDEAARRAQLLDEWATCMSFIYAVHPVLAERMRLGEPSDAVVGGHNALAMRRLEAGHGELLKVRERFLKNFSLAEVDRARARGCQAVYLCVHHGADDAELAARAEAVFPLRVQGNTEKIAVPLREAEQLKALGEVLVDRSRAGGSVPQKKTHPILKLL